MIMKNINGHVVKIYDSIEELPIINFQKYNKFMLIDSVSAISLLNFPLLIKCNTSFSLSDNMLLHFSLSGLTISPVAELTINPSKVSGIELL